MVATRGTGKTTRQMLGAPLGSHFIWCNGTLSYPAALARKLGRSDLKIHRPSDLRSGRLRGVDPALIVVDHWISP